MWTIVLSFLGVATGVAAACSHAHGAGPLRFLKATFTPLTKHDFWFPPCPLCWGVLLASIVVIGLAISNFT